MRFVVERVAGVKGCVEEMDKMKEPALDRKTHRAKLRLEVSRLICSLGCKRDPRSHCERECGDKIKSRND